MAPYARCSFCTLGKCWSKHVSWGVCPKHCIPASHPPKLLKYIICIYMLCYTVGCPLLKTHSTCLCVKFWTQLMFAPCKTTVVLHNSLHSLPLIIYHYIICRSLAIKLSSCFYFSIPKKFGWQLKYCYMYIYIYIYIYVCVLYTSDPHIFWTHESPH